MEDCASIFPRGEVHVTAEDLPALYTSWAHDDLVLESVPANGGELTGPEVAASTDALLAESGPVDLLLVRARIHAALVQSAVDPPRAAELADLLVARLAVVKDLGSSWREDLALFLAAAFSADELRAWIWGGPRGVELVALLPEGASAAQQAQILSERLERDGGIDQAFFERLARARPLRVAEVLRCRDRWRAR